MASGMPSSRRQISATGVTLAPVSANVGSTAVARSTKSLTASVAARGVEVRRCASPGVAGPAGQVRDGTWIDRLTGDRERLATRGRGSVARGRREQPLRDPRDGVDEVLGVVEDEEQVLRGEEVDDELEGRPAGHLGDAQGPRDLRADLARVGEWRELREPDAVGEPRRDASSDFEHQPGLARAAGPDERDEPRLLERRPHRRGLLLTADEGRERHRQVRASCADRSERRERRRKAGRRELEDLLGPIEVAQAMEPRSSSSDLGRDAAARQAGRDGRQEDLAAVPDREDPGVAIERLAEEVALARLGRPRVDRHPDPERSGRAPPLVAQRALGGQRGVDGIRGLIEDREHPIAHRLDHRPARVRDRVTEEPVVDRERRAHRLGLLLPQPRAALDVGQEERREGGRDGRERDGRRHGRSRERRIDHHRQAGRTRSTNRPMRRSASSRSS